MATSREVQRVLKRFTKQIDRANSELVDTLEMLKDLEKALEEYNADENLDITRGIKAEIRRGRKQIDELRQNADKLKNELSDTNRKYHYLAT